MLKTNFSTGGDFERNTFDFSDGLAGLTEGLARSGTKPRWVYIDKSGKVILATDFAYAGRFAEGLAPVYDAAKKKWGFINKSGSVVIPLRYDFVSPLGFSEGCAVVGEQTAAK